MNGGGAIGGGGVTGASPTSGSNSGTSLAASGTANDLAMAGATGGGGSKGSTGNIGVGATASSASSFRGGKVAGMNAGIFSSVVFGEAVAENFNLPSCD